MQHVVIFEPDASGHRMVFVRYIVEAMVRAGGVRATLVTTQTGITPWIGEASRTLDILSVMTVDPAPESWSSRRLLPGKIQRQNASVGMLEQAVTRLANRGRVDHVLVPFLDDYVLLPYALRWPDLGGTPWSGIAIRPRFHLAAAGAIVPRRPADWVERWAHRRLLRDPTLDTLFSIDPYLAAALDDCRVVTVCDPADLAEPVADPIWATVPEDAVVLLVYGYIDHRKAIDRLLRVAARTTMSPALVVALVGTQAPDMGFVLQSSDATVLRGQGRLLEIATFVDDAGEAAAFARADVVWGFYPGSYCSSGAMVRAGQMGRPLLTTREGLAGLITSQAGSGLTAPEGDDAALAAQLGRLIADPALRARLGAAGRDRFAAATGAAFGDHIVERLLGRGTDG